MSSDHRWTAPTPVRARERREARTDDARPDRGLAAPDQVAGRASVPGKPRDPGHRPTHDEQYSRGGRRQLDREPTPEELARARELYDAGLVRPAPDRDHPKVREYQQAQYHDQRGAPCACDEYGACALHLILDGRRRHHRPGYRKATRDRTTHGGRPGYVPEID